MANVNINNNIDEKLFISTQDLFDPELDASINSNNNVINDNIIDVNEDNHYPKPINGCSKQIRNLISTIGSKYILSSVALWICVLILPTIVFGQQSDNDICMQHFHRFNPSHTACLKPNGKCKITKASSIFVFHTLHLIDPGQVI